MTVALRSLAAELDELASEDAERAAYRPPPEIPDFRPVDVLGRGGMGTVYLAEQISLGREVALKIANAPASADASLPDEARTVAQLHHPDIVQVYAAGIAEGRSWFAMELMRGETAGNAGFKSADDVARLGAGIAGALSYAHRCGVVHRDVKPSNIFIGEDGNAKLGDFGLASFSTDAARPSGGTRRYMAPELLDGGAATEASDQYALGATLRELAPCEDADFAAICAKATARDPSGRYESMDVMAEDLRHFLARRPVEANPPSCFRRFRLFARRNPLAASGLAAAAVLLSALAVALAAGYVRTSRALAATEREAESAAQSLARIVAETGLTDSDRREAEILRALDAAGRLAARFPENAGIAGAVERLEAARDGHARFLKRRGGAMRMQHRFRRNPGIPGRPADSSGTSPD